MKKLIGIFCFLCLFTVFASIVISGNSTTLYLLNWGEYIDQELVSKFEKEYNCQVSQETAVSSEIMYQKITSDTTPYDVAVPGDYVVSQLYDEGYLMKLDVNNANYTYLGQYETMFNDDLSNLLSTYMVSQETGEEYNSYFCPYFWGAYSMIYSENKADVPSIIKEKGFGALYDRGLYGENVGIGMYDTARWIVSSYLMSKGYDPNITSYSGSKEGDLSEEIVSDAEAALKKAAFDEIGNDSLKRNVATGALDMCFTQLGDFFDALYLVYDESTGDVNINFNVFVPKTTAAFFDSLVIPTTSKNYDLANKFINFMMDPDNAYQNARAIGYSPTLKAVVEKFGENAAAGEYYYEAEDPANSLSLTSFLEKYPMYLDPLDGCEKVYMLEKKSQQYLTTCETIFNSLA